MGNTPSGTVTFLFTDIEGSSRLWDRYPIEMRVALERHDQILGEVIEGDGGYVFTTAGDSFAAAFQSADGAARAALDIQAAVRAEKWGADAAIRVRIGLHSGEAHERGGDYFGPVVNRAARIESVGHGGQVLVSGVTARILAGSTAAVWHLTGLGEHHLKGLTEPEVVHQLDPTADVVEFGPLNVTHTATSNLTGQSPDLIGRDGDLAQIVGLLEECSLVTVTGVGGVGKTSIATAVAHQHLAATDEVWFIELAPVGDPATVATTVAKTLGIAGAPVELGEITAVLARRGPMLIVLDNCEHVINAVADIAKALAELDNVTVLATTRLELETGDEHVVRLGPLGVSGPSAELFIREARRRNPDFDDRPDHRTTIEAICTAVDGIPLAIELAAAKTRSLDLGQIFEHLDKVLGTAARRSRTHDRHATMTAAINWSIDLLDPDTARGLGVLTVFAGSFDLQAAAAVTAATIGVDPVDTVDELVAHSLLELARTTVGLRYRLLQPVRQRAAEMLLSDPAPVRHAHLEHYVDRLEATYETLGTTGSDPILNLIFHDLDNLRAAHLWALESSRIEDDLRLYRPLSFTAMHEIYEPGDWAAQTAKLDAFDSCDAAGDAMYAAFMTTVFRQAKNDDIPYWSRRLGKLPPSERNHDLLQFADAMQAIGRGDHTDAVEQLHSLRPNDSSLAFTCRFIELSYLRLGSPQVGDPSDVYMEPIDRARQTGAHNFEAGLLEVAALGELRIGHHRVARELARTAETLAAETRMWHVWGRAVEHQIRATILLGEPPESVTRQLAGLLRSASTAGNVLRLHHGLIAAALALQELGREDSAISSFAVVPRGQSQFDRSLFRFDDEALSQAHTRIEEVGLDEFGVASSIADELDAVHHPST